MTVPRLAALAAVLTSFAVPSAASAELTVSKPDATTVLVTEAAIGTDHITVDTTADTVTVTREEFTAALNAGDGCQQATGGEVTCSATGVEKVSIQLGFGDDMLLEGTGTLRREVNGRFGRDTIVDQPGDDHLTGGTDDDTFVMRGGNDTVVGDDPNEPSSPPADDWISYRDSTAGVDVTLPATGTSTGNGAGTEDDTISGVEHVQGSQHADDLTGNVVRNQLYGNDGGDTLDGAGGQDDVYGHDGDDTLRGGAGNDHLWGAGGADELDGGADVDRLNAVDDPLEADTAIDCGDGDGDTLDADNLTDPEPIGCEIVAPEFYEGPEIVAFDAFMEGQWAAVGDFSVTGGSVEDEIEVEWWRCPWDQADCNLRLITDQPGYELTAEDVDSVLYAVVRVSNEAGEDVWITGDTPVIEPAPFVEDDPRLIPPPPPPPQVFVFPPGPPPYGDYGDYADTLEQRLAPLEASVGGSLRSLARRWNGRDPRALARRRFIPHRVKFPETGELVLTWSATVGSARAAAARRVTIGRGRARGAQGSTRTVRVRPTARGRAVLRRSRSLRVTVAATFVGGAATVAAPAEARRTFRLRRRSR
jgi:hypothetical protein